MNLNLRNAIKKCIWKFVINGRHDCRCLQNGEEKMLPGLGVLFEVIWQNSSEQEKQEMITALEQD